MTYEIFGKKGSRNPVRRTLLRAICICQTFLTVSLVSTFATAAERDESLTASGASESRPHMFMVSGVLRSNGSGVEIKLVHSWVQAKSGDEALGLFARKALKEYSGYTIATTLVSEVVAEQTQCTSRSNEQDGLLGNRGVEI